MTTKIKSVEGVRGIACLMVLMSHLSLIYFPFLHSGKVGDLKSSIEPLITSFPLGFVYSGTAAVYIFFCLSGFILSYCCFKGDTPLLSASKMLRSRYSRLAIPAVASSVICYFVIISGIQNNMPWISAFRNGNEVSLIDSIYSGALESFFLGKGVYNSVLWTMQIEFLGSIGLFLSAPFIAMSKSKASIPLIAAFLIVLFFPGKLGYGFASFALGSYIYLSGFKLSNLAACLLLVVGLYFAGFHFSQSFYSPLFENNIQELPGGHISHYYFYCMLAGFLIVLVAMKSDVLKLFTENIISQWLGKLSFSAYLLQMPLFYCLSGVLYHYFRGDSKSHVIPAMVSMGIMLASLYLISYFFYKYVDKLSTKISKISIRSMIYHNSNEHRRL